MIETQGKKRRRPKGMREVPKKKAEVLDRSDRYLLCGGGLPRGRSKIRLKARDSIPMDMLKGKKDEGESLLGQTGRFGRERWFHRGRDIGKRKCFSWGTSRLFS